MEILAGLLVSIVTQVIKKYVGTTGVTTVLVVFGISIGAAVFYHFAFKFGFWQPFVSILLMAAGTHNLVWRGLEKEV